jgi:hypothetical protein
LEFRWIRVPRIPRNDFGGALHLVQKRNFGFG